MIQRRDVLMASAFASAAVAAEVLKPRQALSLLGPKQRLDDIVPKELPGWRSQNVSDQFAPETTDSLLARLFADIIGRLYVHDTMGAAILMVMAHGDMQSNALQLHRPEVCYPAYGFEIVSNSEMDLVLAPTVVLPMRILAAAQDGAKQTIMYWTRLGEHLRPTTISSASIASNWQLGDELPMACWHAFPSRLRICSFGTDVLINFIKRLVKAVAVSDLPALIGTSRAQALSSIP